MREHWREVLRDEHYEREDEAYQAGLEKNHKKIRELEEELEDKDHRVLALERINDELKRKVEELLAGNACASRGGIPTGRRSIRSRSRSPQYSPPPPCLSQSPSPPPSRRRKEKRKAEPVRSPPIKKRTKPMYQSDSNDTDNIMDELAENTPLNSDEERDVCDAIQQSALSHARESHRVEGEALASASNDQTSSAFLARGRRFNTGTRKPGPGQRPPGDLESHVGDPASFSLDCSVKDAFLSMMGHACIGKDSRWTGDAIALWSPGANQPWFWGYGKPFQMAKEASMIPFDQRSLAQRWTIREATRAEVLPLSDVSVEPDVIHLASRGELPEYIRRDADGRFNVYDIMAWLFLAMTQPEQREGTTAWFWGTACQMFTKLGLYERLAEEVSDSKGNPPSYAPKRFVHAGEFNAKDLAIHFRKCGLMNRLASTVLWDLARAYVNRENRPTPAQRRRNNKRKGKATKKAAVAKTLFERIGESDTIARTFEVPAYDEPPPTGTPPDDDVEMDAEMDQSGQDAIPTDPLPFSPMGPG
ncbi:hypothetical protein F5887DRAFT_1075773 [Amanita rubescens]|nr:hypothetical protein F5887DRAFT_1075773 [Amanita rubescens]